MSLKGFHIFFILIATVFCFGFTTWAFMGSENLEAQMKVPGIITGGLGVVLLVYGVWFAWKKAATIHVA